MRIIAGSHRGRPILPPRDAATTRPITDRVKQSLFDRLWSLGLLGDSPAEFGHPWMTGGGNVLDVFSGTGSLGLEALSRGADHCTFVETDRSARELLQRNLDHLELAGSAAILSVDALTTGWLAALPQRPLRLVFLDPPYRLTLDPASLQRLTAVLEALAAGPDMVERGALAMLRTDDHARPLPAAGWTGPERVEFGSMVLHFYRAP